MTFPWEKLVPEHDPFVFVRLRITHNGTVKYVGIRADDTDITGEISFDNDTALVVKAWGVPTKAEPLMKSSDVMKEIQSYVQQNGLNLR